MTASHHFSSRNRHILSGRSRWKYCTPSLECKQLENVLLLMKAVFAIFLVYHIICHAFYYLLNIKQNIIHAWLPGPHTLGKLIFYDIYLSIKQNLSYAWLLVPHTLGNLILTDIYLSIKQNLSYVWIFGLHALGNLILTDIYLSIKQNFSYV